MITSSYAFNYNSLFAVTLYAIRKSFKTDAVKVINN